MITLKLTLAPSTRAIVYFFVYGTWSREISLAPCPISGVEGEVRVARPPTGTVLPHHASIVIQMGEMIDNRIVLTGTAIVPLADLQPGFMRAISFLDVAQKNEIILEGTVHLTTDSSMPLMSTSEPDLPTLLDRFDVAVEDYVQRNDAFIEKMAPSRPDLLSLYMTSFRQRIGRKFPDIMFFNMERSARTSPRVLHELLRIACYYIGMDESLFVAACKNLAHKSKADVMQAAVMESAMEIIVFAACFSAILSPYAFDKFVTAFGEVKMGERFSSFRVPSRRRRDAVMDCEEMAKLVAVILYDMKHATLQSSDNMYLLKAAKTALSEAGVYSSLMLVKNPNVDTASAGSGGDASVPLNGSTGHMCGLIHHPTTGYSVASIPLSPPQEGDESALNSVFLAEGTGNILSDIRPYDAAHRTTNDALQEIIKTSPFGTYKWEQRKNMSNGVLYVNDPMNTPNNFYTVLKLAYPIYCGMENARSYVAVNSQSDTYGVPISNLVTSGTDATLLALPEMMPETKQLCSAMMGFIPPEVPLTLGEEQSPSAKLCVSEWNGRMKKGKPQEAAFVLSFMKDYGEVTHQCMEEAISWVRQRSDVVHSDMMLFGPIMHSTILIVRLFFN